jgi:hypothetical protein
VDLKVDVERDMGPGLRYSGDGDDGGKADKIATTVYRYTR